MTDINEIRAPVLAMKNLPNVDSAYTMHYDETNNIPLVLGRCGAAARLRGYPDRAPAPEIDT